MPSAIIHVIADYLPNSCKAKLSMGSLYFNQALQKHFKLLSIRESKKERSAFDQIAASAQFAQALTVDVLEKETSSQTQHTNWLVEYGKKHSQQCFALKNASLVLDPFKTSEYPEQMVDCTPVLPGIKAWEIK